ncbi:hypothetical protein Tco_0729110 [Tanacetum coccineum]|uniref:Uncharacterized protein n=1 Tax=Tanacetum coccineum TaxID=301880 RepID=A0ABQ4YMY8_9ASTR
MMVAVRLWWRWQRGDEGISVDVAVVAVVVEDEARGGAWSGRLDRSGGGESFGTRPENSPEKWRRRNTRRKWRQLGGGRKSWPEKMTGKLSGGG